MIYWFTGQSGAGKTVLSTLLKKRLEDDNGEEVFHIDGDDLRTIIINKDYSKEGRYNNIRTAQNIALFINTKGHNVVVSLMSPYKELREEFKSRADVTEIYVHTSDIRGRENFHVADYEPPTENFIDIDTTGISPEDSLKQILERLY